MTTPEKTPPPPPKPSFKKPSRVSSGSGDQLPTSAPPKTAALTDSDLKDGTRILWREGNEFYPARLNFSPAPDIYEIRLAHQRGNKPEHETKEDVLRKAVSDSKDWGVDSCMHLHTLLDQC